MKETDSYTVEFGMNQRMLHIVMQQASSISDIGLLSGQMGLILLFTHYHSHTKFEIYEEMADNLMEEVLSKIHKKLAIDFDSGLTGIGWAIEYLIQNGFMEGDSLRVCNEIDNLIMKTDPRRLNDNSLETGLEGLLHYILAHIQGVKQQTGKLPFDNTYLDDVYSAVNALEMTKVERSMRVLVKKYIKFYKGKMMSYNIDIKPFLRRRKVTEQSLLNTPIGIQNGISGILLLDILS